MIHPAIAPCVRDLSSKCLGLFAGRVQLEEHSASGHATTANEKLYDRFIATIPYAGQSIKWLVYFRGSDPKAGPDFDFYIEDFMQHVEDLEGEELDKLVPTWGNWKADDPAGLVKVIQEFLAVFRKFELDTITTVKDDQDPGDNRSKVQRSVLQLLESKIISEDDLEVLNGSQDKKTDYVMVRLAVDLSKLPETLLYENQEKGENMAALLFAYHPNGQCSSQLFLSPKIDEILGGNKILQIPQFKNFEPLKAYIEVVKSLVQKRIDVIAKNFNTKQMFITTLINEMGRALLEHDATNFTMIAFLLEHNNFQFIVRISLPSNFPDDPPTFTFSSCYHFTPSGEPYVSVCSEGSFLKDCALEEMGERTKKFVLEYIDTFKEKSVRHCK